MEARIHWVKMEYKQKLLSRSSTGKERTEDTRSRGNGVRRDSFFSYSSET